MKGDSMSRSSIHPFLLAYLGLGCVGSRLSSSSVFLPSYIFHCGVPRPNGIFNSSSSQICPGDLQGCALRTTSSDGWTILSSFIQHKSTLVPRSFCMSKLVTKSAAWHHVQDWLFWQPVSSISIWLFQSLQRACDQLRFVVLKHTVSGQRVNRNCSI